MTREDVAQCFALPQGVKTYALLMRLGVTANYAGFHQSAYAVCLAMENPDNLLLVSKYLYPQVAKRFCTNWYAVERNIRTVCRLAWAHNPGLLCELAGYELTQRPRAGQFIAILTFAVRESAGRDGEGETGHERS